MPLKHTDPSGTHSLAAETARSGYSRNAPPTAESTAIAADAITASGRVQNYLRDKRGWMNVSSSRTCSSSAARTLVALHQWLRLDPLISTLCNAPALYFHYRFPYGSILVIAALCLTLGPFPDFHSYHLLPPVGLAAYHTGRPLDRLRPLPRPHSRLGGHSPSPCRPRSRSSTTGTTYPYIFISLMLACSADPSSPSSGSSATPPHARTHGEEFKERARHLGPSRNRNATYSRRAPGRTHPSPAKCDIVALALQQYSQADGALRRHRERHRTRPASATGRATD